MPRKPRPTAAIIEVTVNEEQIAADMATVNELALTRSLDTDNAKKLAAQLGYAGSLDPDVLEQTVRLKSAQIAQSIFEFGASLLLLRESCLHGDWYDRLERLQIETRTAQRYMSIAAKFRSTGVAKALEGFGLTKLVELTVLDDEEVKAFVDGETVRGIVYDETDRMSIKELRKKLRETEANYESQGKLIGSKDKKINELTVATQRKELVPPTPDGKAAELIAIAHEAESTACAWIEGHLKTAISEALDHDAEHGSNHRAVLSGFIARIEDATDALRLAFALPRIKTGEDDPFGELPDDFLEKQGVTMPKPINVDADGKLFDPAKVGGKHAAN